VVAGVTTYCECGIAEELHPLEHCPGFLANGLQLHTPDRVIRASEIRPERIEWLWQGFVPRGMTTVFTGLPGVGKSTIIYDLIARTTREGSAALVVTAEDHLAAVVRPRLEVAAADLDAVHVYTVDLTLPDDVELLHDIVVKRSAALVMLDPLVAFIGDNVNTHRDHHVRRVLAPLGDLAQDTGAAVVVVVHSNKGTASDPLLRISGSVGFGGAARSVVVAADDPQDEGRRIFGCVKSNLAELPAPLAYRLVGVELNDDIRTSKVEWLGEAPEVDMRELLSVPHPDKRTARDEAIDFLKRSGVYDEAQPAPEILEDAKAHGIGDMTLQRARRALGILVWKQGYPAVTYWGPRPDRQSGQTYPVHSVHSGLDLQQATLRTTRVDTLPELGDGTPAPSCACDECGAWPHQGGHFASCSRRSAWLAKQGRRTRTPRRS